MTDWRVIGRRSGGVEVEKMGRIRRQGDGGAERGTGNWNSEGKDGRQRKQMTRDWDRGLGTGVGGDIPMRGEKKAGSSGSRV